MTSDTTEPSDDSGNGQVGEKTQQNDVHIVKYPLFQSTEVKIEGNTVTAVQQTVSYFKLGTTNGTDKPITAERQGQLHCEECEMPCGFTEQPAIEMFQGRYLCPYCITDIIRATKKSLKELRDKIHDL